MIDIHSHLIFNTDDGPSTLDEAVSMVKEAVEAGVKVIIATPHFKGDLEYTWAAAEKLNRLSAVISGMDVSLKIGYEVPITTPDLLRYCRSLSLNSSCYLLLELPFEDIPIYTKDVIFGLELEKITPVLAHPERNKKLRKNMYLMAEYIGRGCLIQVDAGSILGINGRKVKRFTKRLIKHRLVHFVASDAHKPGDYSKMYLKAYKKVRKWSNEAYADKLFYRNPRLMIENEPADIYEIV